MSIPDFALEETVDFKFTTRAFATGIPATLGGTPVVDIYEDNSVTQITGAETLTVDFDSVTGLNNLRVAATAANGFESGKSYAAVITTGTVGGVSVVGEVVAQFTIDRQSLRPTTAGNTLDVTSTGAAGIDWGNIENPTTAVDLSGTDIQLCDTVTTNTDMRGTDNAALASVLGALSDTAAAGDPTASDTVVQYLKQIVNTLEGTTGIPTFPSSAVPANNVSMAETLRQIYDEVSGLNGDAMRGTDSASTHSAADVWTSGTRTLTASTNFNDLSTADIDARLAAIGLDHLLSAAVVGTDVADNSIFARLVSASATADWDDFANTTDSLQAIRDRGDTDWVTASGFSTHSAADVWAAATRTLTAGTNLNDISTSDVKTQIDTALTSDTIAELAQAAPSATPTIATALMLLYMMARNKLDITNSVKEVHNNAGTVITKKTLSDDGTTYSEAEMVSGP